MKIVTSFVYPPIPSRAFDWCAYDESNYDLGSPTGYGPTPEAAIADLLEQIEEEAA